MQFWANRMIEIQGYLHTAILVSDLKKAEEFYGGILGLEKVDRPFNYDGIWYQIGNGQLHLIVDEGYKNIPHNSGKLGRNPHIAFGVLDMNSLQVLLEDRGYSYQLSASGRKALFTQDADGNIIELTEVVS